MKKCVEKLKLMKTPQVLIIAKKGTLRSSLAEFLRAIPGVGEVAQMQDQSEALKRIELNAPNLVVLDFEVGGLEFLAELQIGCPGVRSLVLVDDMRQQTQAQVAGADVALIKGYPAHELIKTVQALLSHSNSTS